MMTECSNVRMRRAATHLRQLAAMLAVVALAVTVTACGGGADDDDADAGPTTTIEVTPELQVVMDAAVEEGELLLAWQGVLGDIDGAPELIDGFKDYYDLDLDVSFTPGSGQGEMATKVEQELNADLPASTDVISLNASAVRQVAERGVIEAVDWASFSPNVSDPEMIAAGGAAVNVQSWVMGIVYHTDRVTGDEVPTSMEQLLEPTYEGRIYTTPFGGGFDLLASDDGWGRERTLEYVESFADHVGGLGFNIQPILTGEFDIMALMVPPSSALRAKADGAPVEFVIPTDAALLYENYVSIPSNSAHPNAARLFIDYLMSPEGQSVLRRTDFADSPLVDGSLTGEQIDEAESDGAEFIDGDVEWYTRQDPDEYDRNAEDLLGVLLNRGD
jgi:iron(III) transport system substrate-binding protein